MNEELFQLVWSSLAFNTTNLKTLSGEKIDIISPGTRNRGDGPDFNNGTVSINNISFYGDIELHLRAKNWYLHNHHTDPRYNRVVLHVVLYDEDLCDVIRQDQTKPSTLVLKPYLSVKIRELFKKSHSVSVLPCHGLSDTIPESIIRAQWIQAQNEYFEQKTDYLLRFYSEDLPPSTAWRNMLSSGLFDGLGISKNRSAMVQLHNHLRTDHSNVLTSLPDLLARANDISGLSPETDTSKMSRNDWDFSSSRPNNQPDIRIPQACLLLYNMEQIPFQRFLHDDLNMLWDEIVCRDHQVNTIGKQRQNVLFYTVFLPAMHLLGTLFMIPAKRHQAFELWQQNKLSIPQKIKKKYSGGDFPEIVKKYPAGTIYQFKHYCKETKCPHCKLMKYILKS